VEGGSCGQKETEWKKSKKWDRRETSPTIGGRIKPLETKRSKRTGIRNPKEIQRETLKNLTELQRGQYAKGRWGKRESKVRERREKRKEHAGGLPRRANQNPPDQKEGRKGLTTNPCEGGVANEVPRIGGDEEGGTARP